MSRGMLDKQECNHVDLMIFTKKSSMASRPHETSLPTRWSLFFYPGNKNNEKVEVSK